MKLNRSDIIKVLLSIMGFVLFVFIFIHEIPYKINVFKLPLVLSISAAVGIIFAITVGYTVSKKLDELIEKFQVYVGSVILCTILFPLVINLSNRIYTVKTNEILYLIEVEEMFGMILKGPIQKGKLPEPTAYLIHLKRHDDSIEKVRVTNNIAEGLNRGDLINLSVEKGIFGIRFIRPE